MRYLRWIAPLTLLYVAITANFEPSNWLLGLTLAVGITTVLRPDPAPIMWKKLPGALLVFLQFLLELVWDLLLSSVQVARIVLQKEINLRQGIFALPTGSRSEAITVLSAKAITVTPGELVVEIDEDGVMYTHSLDVEQSQKTAVTNQQARVQQLEQLFT